MGVDLNFPIPNGSGVAQDTDTTDRVGRGGWKIGEMNLK